MSFTRAAHKALDRVNGTVRLRQQSASRRFSHDDVSIGIEADHRRAKSRAVRTENTLRLFGLRIEIRDQTVGGSEIDSDDSCHFSVR
jgi:hypothetical protein